MSKWNRPMRRFQVAEVACRQCARPIQITPSGWRHMERVPYGITDPRWHVAKP